MHDQHENELTTFDEEMNEKRTFKIGLYSYQVV